MWDIPSPSNRKRRIESASPTIADTSPALPTKSMTESMKVFLPKGDVSETSSPLVPMFGKPTGPSRVPVPA